MPLIRAKYGHILFKLNFKNKKKGVSFSQFIRLNNTVHIFRETLSMKTIYAALLTLTFTVSSFAELPEPPDPRDIVRMSVQERIEKSSRLQDELLKATPQERKIFRQKMRQNMETLTAKERHDLHEEMHKQWQSMSKEQQDIIRQNRKKLMEQLTPEERIEIKEHRQKALEQMSPQERQKWHDEMHKESKTK